MNHALVVAHPGHEVRVHGWLSAAKPVTYVLTDGSGATGTPRTPQSMAIVRDAGAAIGSVFGRLVDADAYSTIRTNSAAVFVQLAEELARDFIERDITSVSGDAAEGYNPVHDVCRLVIDAAVAMTKRDVENWSFLVIGAVEETRGDKRQFVLDDDAFARKIRTAEAYREIAPDVAAAIRDFGEDTFRVEVFSRVTEPSWRDRRFLDERPFYETHGEARVREGKYPEAIRYREHILPIAEALARAAENA